jgi:hypothetical protein
MLPILLLGVSLMAGCARGKLYHKGDLLIERTTYRGWEDAVGMTNGRVEVVVVPRIARIMRYAYAGRENLLWVNEELTPEARGPDAAPLQEEGWHNFGGYKLWPAPQKEWNWPPPWRLDRGPCKVEVTEEGTLVLRGMEDPEQGVRFDRELRLDVEGTRLGLLQRVVNVSDGVVTTAIWDVTQVNADCVGFVPLGPDADYRTLEGGGLDEQWRKVGDFLLVRPAGQSGKVFVDGPPGWLGCRWDDLIYLKAFELGDRPPPKPESPREVFTGEGGYIELEVVGPEVTLQPGESATLEEVWYLLPAGAEADSAEGLINVLEKRVPQLTLPGQG